MKFPYISLSKYLPLLLILFSIQFSICQTTYDFESDTSGSTPLNITATNGTIITDSDGTRGLTMHPLTITSGIIGSYDMDLFPTLTDYSVTWKETYATATRSGFTLRASGSNSSYTGLKQGYYFQARVDQGFARIFTSNASGFTLISSVALTASGANTARSYRATVDGTTLTFEYSDDGGTSYTSVGSVTDATYSSGTTQFSIGYGAGVGDTYIDDVELIDLSDLSISNISEYQVFQRDGSDQADISISGTYTGIPTAIEASFNGGAYVTIDSSPSGGTFSGTLPNQAAGQGDLTVRFTNDTSTNLVLNTIGIGDVFVVAGQSNASGRGFTLNSYTHASLKASMFGNDDAWKELTDATDSAVGQVDAVSLDTAAALGGSPWPIVATSILADTGFPVAFIPTSMGGTKILPWLPDADHSDATTLYGSMYRRIQAVGGAVAGVLFFQGESDAQGAVTQAVYETRLNTFVDAVASDFSGAKTLVGQIGNLKDATFGYKDRVRAGQIAVINSNSNALLGPAVYDIDLTDEGGDNIHFRSDSDMALFSDRWIAAIGKEFYSGMDGYGPILDEPNLFYSTALNKVIVPFIDESSPAINSASTVSISSFDLKNDGTSVTISSIDIVGDNIEITPTTALNSALSITLTYASENTAVNAAVYDSNDYPAQPFYDVTVLTSGTVISLYGASTISLRVGDTYTESSATAIDAVDGDITSNIVTSGTVDVNTTGSYTITYTVTNSASTTFSVDRTVIVYDALILENTTITYDFECEEPGISTANVTPSFGGTLETDSDATRTQTMTILSGSGQAAAFDMDLFPASADYSVTWKETYTVVGQSAFTLRASGASNLGAGLKQGYLFQARSSQNTARIYRLSSSGTSAVSTAIPLPAPGVNTPRWYRATVQGSTLTFEYSDDGVTFTTITSQTDTTYSSGTTQFSRGWGGATYTDSYIDDVTCTIFPLIYDFESDTTGATPADMTVTNGTLSVDFDASRSNTLIPLTVISNPPSNQVTIAGDMELFLEYADYSIEWKEIIASGGRTGFVLRSGTSLSSIDTVKEGYLFQVNTNGFANDLRIFKLAPLGFTRLNPGSATLSAPASGVARWYRATVIGDVLSFEYSDDGGTTYTLYSSVTDTTYTKGTTQYTTGYSSPLPVSYIDDVIFTPKITCENIGTANWSAGAWDSFRPSKYTGVTLQDDYDTATGGIESNICACNLSVSNNSSLNIEDNTFIEVGEDLTVDGGSFITVQSKGAFLQIEDTGTVTNSGTISVNKLTASMDSSYEYTYWSSPVQNETIGTALLESNANRRFLFNGQNFLDETAETLNDNTTSVGQDDVDDDGNDWAYVSETTIMTPGVGYASTHNPSLFTGVGQYLYTFEGDFNNGIITTPVYRNDYETADSNWNFIGNPYPSAIDADLFLTTNSDFGAILFWSHKMPASVIANGNEDSNYSDLDYAIINGSGETAGGDGVTPSRFIPSGQSFFVSLSNGAPATLVSGDIYSTDAVFNNSMRVKGTTDNSQFFKTSNSKTSKSVTTSNYNKLWINLTSDLDAFSQILISYIDGATNFDDGMKYDATKNISIYTSSTIYSLMEGSNKKFTIQGKETSSIDIDEVIKLGFCSFKPNTTLYNFSIGKLQGDFLTRNTVYLKDNLLNKVHDLSNSDYSFVSEIGVFNNRFEIVFNTNVLSINDSVLNKNNLIVTELDDDQVLFKILNDLDIKSVNIFDLLGRNIYSFNGQHSSEVICKLSNLHNTVYIANVELSGGIIISKKLIKR
jgi:hypothetical protein